MIGAPKRPARDMSVTNPEAMAWLTPISFLAPIRSLRFPKMGEKKR
jgi:hypothetical protein